MKQNRFRWDIATIRAKTAVQNVLTGSEPSLEAALESVTEPDVRADARLIAEIYLERVSGDSDD